MNTTKTYLALTLFVILGTCTAQDISESLNAFSINLIATTNSEGSPSLNIALSPFTIWTLLAIISEGSQGKTKNEISNVLNLSQDQKKVRADFRELYYSLQKNSEDSRLEFNNAIFTNQKYILNKEFERNAKDFYNVTVRPIDFVNAKYAYSEINNYVAESTNQRITNLITPDDIKDAHIFLTSVLFFKGAWKTPFNNTATKKENFYDENGNVIGQVDMMYQLGYFPFSRVADLNAYAIKLPYGQDGKMSMIVLVPYKGTIANSLDLLSKVGFKRLTQILEDAEEKFVDEEIHVYLPKFKIISDFIMDRVLNKMGIKSVFNSQEANLLGILNHYLYITKLLQRAEIEVNEEGTIASAAAGAAATYKSFPPKFLANKPFLYFLVDNPTNSIVFGGKFSNPN